MSGSFRSIEDMMREQEHRAESGEAATKRSEIVGHRADLIAVDDPYNGRLTKNEEEDYYTQPMPVAQQVLIVAPNNYLANKAARAAKSVSVKRNLPQSNIRFTAPGGPLLGSRFDFIIVMDSEFKRQREREELARWVEEFVWCRLQPGGQLIWL